jgi:hypothetical protein
MSIPKIIQRYRIGEQPKDFIYWQSRSFEERLGALEEIRREYNAWKYRDQQGLQRIFRIVDIAGRPFLRRLL